MNLNEIEAKVIAGLKEVQQISNRPWTDLDPSSKPIGDLEGFDSLASIEATVLIEDKLGCRIECDSLFISDDGTRALTVKQICERVAQQFGKNGRRPR